MVNFIAAARENEHSVRSYADTVALVGRILLATIFVMSGAAKLADPAGTIGYIGAAGLPLAPVAYAGAVAIELGGGIALILGYRTRIVAATLALFSLLAAMGFHSAFADQNQMIHFMKNVAMAGGLLQVVAFGGGRLSLDARFQAA
ncbi:MAG: DoxX family protein [Pseudomonadota bacterium]|nr:DoxX family protein [Pseudomonadota bacterium]